MAQTKAERAAYCKAWARANRAKLAAAQAKYRKANKEKIAAYDKAHGAARYKADPEPAKARAAAWQRANPGKVNARASRRRAAQLQATPKWLAAEDHAAITELYEMAASLTESTGIDHHVDHVVPLQGKQVKGLHVPWNLQVLQATDNLQKSNKLDPALLEPMRLAA